MSPRMTLEPVGEGEEYPIVGMSAPAGFERTQSGYACKTCGALTPLMAKFAELHSQWHVAQRSMSE